MTTPNSEILRIYRNDTFDDYWVVWHDEDGNPAYDLTGYTAKMQIKDDPEDVSSILEITETPNVNGSVLTIDGPNAEIAILIAKEDTNLTPSDPVGQPSLVSDIEVVSPTGRKKTLVYWDVIVLADTTR